MQTKRKLIVAMFASSLMAGAAYAQDAGAQAGTTGSASGTVKMNSQNSAKPIAPGQQQKAGSVDSAAEAAPGQKMKDGTVDSASEAAPGQVKSQDQAAGEIDEDDTTDSPSTAQSLAPGQQQKDGAVDSAAEAAPGQKMKDGTVDSASEAAPGQMKSQDQASDENGSGVSDETTASIDLTTEQRTEVKQVFTTQSVEPVDIDIDLSVGVAVPRTVTLHPVPPRIGEIVPAYQGYDYFVLADGRIVIVEPDTLHVVYILV